MRWKAVDLSGFGRLTRAPALACAPASREAVAETLRRTRDNHGLICHAGGRSYGDVALNSGGRVILTTGLNRVLSFDPESGAIACEAGVTFHDLMRDFLPRGFVAPVSPGTGHATLGGAVANDIHGKNHDRHGSFGDHVSWLDLLLPSGEVTRIGPEERGDWFSATVGGLGLTGVILALGFRLCRVPSNAVVVTERPIPGLDGFFDAFEEARHRATYSVAWIDGLARGPGLGRGVLETAEPSDTPLPARPVRRLRLPVDLPAWVLCPSSIGAFNAGYYHRIPRRGRTRVSLLERFLYPLDALLDWNRMYGRRGFYQFQCVIPDPAARLGIRGLIEEVARARAASFLAVLKTLGGSGRGMLSFPLRGYTLALDFPRREGTEALLARLAAVTRDHGGRVYLAKDACLPRALFEDMYPRLPEYRRVLEAIDPEHRMSSDLARRLGLRPAPDPTPSTRDRRRQGPDAPSTTMRATQAQPAPQLRLEPEVPAIPRPKLLGVEDAKALTVAQTADLFRAHLNPGQYHFLKLLGFHEVVIERAEGMYYIDKRGWRILDFFGGFGSLALGHNHPRILATRRRFQDEQRHEIAIAFMSQYASALAKNLASIAPGDLDMVFLGSAGSEAVEAALKLAEKVQGPERSTVAYAEHSFHGKTRAALSVTDSEFYQSTFRLLDNRVRIPFGDADALEAALDRDRSIGVLILETVQGGGGIVLAPPGYWRAVRRLCDRYQVVWLADEVQCGVGRTGRFFAFEHEGVVPDIVTLAKSLGGGKTAIGAMIARRPLYMKAYGTPKTALIHGPATFGGIGEACATAIEALNVLYDERLIENSAVQGAYLLEGLRDLKLKHANILKDVRGLGLMVGIEFQDFSQTLPMAIRPVVSILDDKLKGSLCGFVGSLLLKDHRILVAFTEYNRNVIRLEPPLIASGEHIDTFISALDEVLSRGITGIITDYAKHFLRASL